MGSWPDREVLYMADKVLGQETCDFLSNLDTVKDEKRRSPHISSLQTVLLGNKKRCSFPDN